MGTRAAIAFALALSACSLIVDLGGLGGGSDASAGDSSSDSSSEGGLVVRCSGSPSCTPPDVCCGLCPEDDAGNCNYTFSCSSSTSCGGIPLGCSDPGSCLAGQVCCAELGSNSDYMERTRCSTRAECDASAPSIYLCDPNATTPCPFGGTCLSSKTGDFANLYECR